MSKSAFKLSNSFVTWYARMLVLNDPSFEDFFQFKNLGENAADIHAKFVAFHTANPDVYEQFKKFSKEVKSAGHKRYSADAIMHRIRWECDVRLN